MFVKNKIESNKDIFEDQVLSKNEIKIKNEKKILRLFEFLINNNIKYKFSNFLAIIDDSNLQKNICLKIIDHYIETNKNLDTIKTFIKENISLIEHNKNFDYKIYDNIYSTTCERLAISERFEDSIIE